jgi:hypothetical protein
MRKANSLVSRTVVTKLLELGYLNDRRLLTRETVRIALDRLRKDLCSKATIQVPVERNDANLSTHILRPAMSKPPVSFFNCPRCGADYKVVRIEAERAELLSDKIRCLSCDDELAAREDTFILKYFLIGPSRKGSRRNRKP